LGTGPPVANTSLHALHLIRKAIPAQDFQNVPFNVVTIEKVATIFWCFGLVAQLRVEESKALKKAMTYDVERAQYRIVPIAKDIALKTSYWQPYEFVGVPGSETANLNNTGGTQLSEHRIAQSVFTRNFLRAIL
jgi:hypothetical protein